MRKNWSVYYEIYTGETKDAYEENGYEEKDVSFRKAINEFGYDFHKYPVITNLGKGIIITRENAEFLTWFGVLEALHSHDGECKDVYLEIPEGITPSSKLRLARLIMPWKVDANKGE